MADAGPFEFNPPVSDGAQTILSASASPYIVSILALVNRFEQSHGIHTDTAAGQGTHFRLSDFHGTTTPISMRIDGVGGSEFVTAHGTVYFLLTAQGSDVATHVGIFHNTLFAPMIANTSILSVSQAQQHVSATSGIKPNSCHTDNNIDPYAVFEGVRFALFLSSGLFMLPCATVPCLTTALANLPQVVVTPPGPFTPPTSSQWSLVPCSSTPIYTNFAHSVDPASFRQALADTSSLSTALTPATPQNRTYATSAPDDIRDLSRCLMTPSNAITKATISLSHGLSLKSRSGLRLRGDPDISFPEGSLRRRPVPARRLADLTNTLSPAPKEILGGDTVFSCYPPDPMAEVYFDLGSKLIAVYKMPRRTFVARTFQKFCSEWWTPRILMKDGAAENKSRDLEDVCIDKDVCQIFRTPGNSKVAVQNYAEAAIGHITRKATYAMVYAGATIRYWFLALQAACFVDSITAHWYTDISEYSTPYFRIFGQQFPDSGVLHPWGCAALILLPGDSLSKFLPRTVKMIFVSYAPNHPTYTFGFLNCVTGRISHSQDAIFLVNEFPFRDARLRLGSSPTGDSLTPRLSSYSRSPYSHLAPPELRFDWAGGPSLPDFTDFSQPSLDMMDAAEPLPDGEFEEDAYPPIPPKLEAQMRSLHDDELDVLHDFLLGKSFPHPSPAVGMATITGHARWQRAPVTFYNNLDLEEDFSSTWEVYHWLSLHSPQPSVHDILSATLPTAVPAAPIPPDQSSLHDRRPVRACRHKVHAYKCSTDVPSKLHPKTRRKVMLGMYASFDGPTVPPRTWKVKHLSPKATRAIFKARQSIFQGGVRIPNNDKDAEDSPEWRSWAAGKRLEHVRLDKVKAFLKGLRISDVIDTGYPRSGIVILQHVYAFKHSGEFRVRCVARGDHQHPSTVTITFAPTASMYTVRLFYAIAIEELHVVLNGDVPQAFLQGKQDTPLYVWAPKSERSFPGECWQCLLPLYGFRSSAAYWFREVRAFLESLGFIMDPLAVCHFRKFLDTTPPAHGATRAFVQLVLVVDDYALSGPADAAAHYHAGMQKRFNATSETGKMFVGYDIDYNLDQQYVKISFKSYITRMLERFSNVDLSKGAPLRELVGSLIWTTQNLHAGELIRVKSHAPKLNDFTAHDYDDAIATMHAIAKLQDNGIVYRHGGAGKEFVPPSHRPDKIVNVSSPPLAPHLGHEEMINEFEESDIYTGDEDPTAYGTYPINSHYCLTTYVDAAFAVDRLMRSISGAVILLNGRPLDWAGIIEGLVVDSTTNSETLSYSSGIKLIKHAANRLKFFHIQCPTPHKMYTDSTGGKLLAANPNKLGRVRHLNIRHHLVKCYIQIGEIDLIYCVTEAMLGDLLTKCVDAAQKRNLGLRFYNDCIFPDGRFYKFHCFESDCVVRIATSADFIPTTNFPLIPVPSSPSWTRDNFPADSETVSKDPRWCSTTALRLQQRFLTTE